MSTTPKQPRTATAARRRHIVDHLRSLGHSESIGDLSQLFGVSTSTIRRDVDALSDKSKIWKISGGRRHDPTTRAYLAREGTMRARLQGSNGHICRQTPRERG
nr:DeoR family transcriptional regulator [Cutibacterium acnes]